MRRLGIVLVLVVAVAIAVARLWPAPGQSTASARGNPRSTTSRPLIRVPGPGPARPTTTSATATTDSAQINALQDPSPSQEAAQAGAIAARPAYQHLPFKGNGIVATIAGYAGDEVVVDVISQSSLGTAQAAWAAFLATWHDPGRAYLVHFHPNVGNG